MKQWKLTKINQGYQMTKVEGQEIACRELNWWEKIRYFFITHLKELSKEKQ